MLVQGLCSSMGLILPFISINSVNVLHTAFRKAALYSAIVAQTVAMTAHFAWRSWDVPAEWALFEKCVIYYVLLLSGVTFYIQRWPESTHALAGPLYLGQVRTTVLLLMLLLLRLLLLLLLLCCCCFY